MKKTSRFYLVWLWVLFVSVLFVAGCTPTLSESLPLPTLPPLAERSPEEQALVGQWRVNEGRFGNKIFDFKEDGRLLIEDVDSAQTSEMAYLFTEEDAIVLYGDEAFNGSATLKFYENKLDLTVRFDRTIYGELYVFTRVDGTSD